MPHLNPSWVIGKTIARVEMNPFDDGKGGTAHNPRIYFADGSSIGFVTEETEVGEYGTTIIYSKQKPEGLTDTSIHSKVRGCRK